jgi:hypothetical protein
MRVPPVHGVPATSLKTPKATTNRCAPQKKSPDVAQTVQPAASVRHSGETRRDRENGRNFIGLSARVYLESHLMPDARHYRLS